MNATGLGSTNRQDFLSALGGDSELERAVSQVQDSVYDLKNADFMAKHSDREMSYKERRLITDHASAVPESGEKHSDTT